MENILLDDRGTHVTLNYVTDNDAFWCC